MTQTGIVVPEPQPAGGDAASVEEARAYGLPALIKLAWPASLSFLLNGAYRINDQYWIQGLGGEAQAATGAVMFVAIMNFAIGFLAGGGALSLTARALGAGSTLRLERVARHALFLALFLGSLMLILGPLVTPLIVRLLGLEGRTAELAGQYLLGLYSVAPAMMLAPTLDNLFLGRGRSRIPLLLQTLAIGSNFLLNPILIYGRHAAEAMPAGPGSQFAARIGAALGIDGFGMSGAAWATGASRALAVVLGLLILRYGLNIKLLRRRPPERRLLLEIVRISAPVSLSIALYAGVYWALLGLVLSRLPNEVKGGLAIGFQVFEGVSYPVFLGLSVATAALIGRALGARRPELAQSVLGLSRRVATGIGLLFNVAFLVLAEPVARRFTEDPAVYKEVLVYVNVLAFSQFFVGQESVNEKALLGAGLTRPIPWIAGSGNLLRIPLAYALALPLGFGAAGVWWAIAATSGLKALGFWLCVRRGDWKLRLGERS